ncbi:MAG: hypothetical protein ABL933_00920 [Methyloglobulus sp.]|nr:hypothetical protein [Methyloglobulus sp.]
MKLILQIAAGVYLGMVCAQLTVDTWRSQQQKSANQVAAKQIEDRNERIRKLFMQGRKITPTLPENSSP